MSKEAGFVKSTKRIRGSLAAKLLLLIVGVSLSLAVIVSGITIWQERQQAIAAEQREARAAVMANIDTLALAVWSFDDRVLNVTASSLIRGPGIFRVDVFEDGQPRLSLDRYKASMDADYTWEVPLLRPNTNQPIGTLRISESYVDIKAALQRRAIVLVFAELTKILATSVLVFLVTYFLATRPLQSLVRKVESVKERESGEAIEIFRPFTWGRDEIDALVDAINASNVMRRRMQAEQRYRESREANAGKLEALGQLAGSIAHDFNNILGTILGFAALLRDDLSEKPQQRRFVQRILLACERGRELIEQIRVFSRSESTERKIVDFLRVVRQNENLLVVSLPKTTQLRCDYSGDILPVFGNEAQLWQVVANLCINASEALNGRFGVIRMSVGRANRNELEKLRASALSKAERLVGQIGDLNDYAYLRVTDTAGGISDTVLDHMFEPFFTTKGGLRGTGLGLSVVKGVVEAHAGACHVVSRPGEGMIFSVYLPLRTGHVTEPVRSLREPETRGSERILIVDDEPDIVDMLSIGLERLGYEVVGVTDPLEAFAAFEEDPKAFDTVITDEMMTNMRGLELVRRLKSIRSDVKVVLCTGYSDSATDEFMQKIGVDIFLLKPVDAGTIASKLRQVMAASAANRA